MSNIKLIQRAKRLVIFEGPDGGGKTTAAKLYATEIGARYVHFGLIPKIGGDALCRIYLDAMLPALLGYQSVVMDRSWISEPIYGLVYRGVNRLSTENRRMLERVALVCGASVVLCLPSFESCSQVFNGRRDQEYLKSTSTLQKVYNRYAKVAEDGIDLDCFRHAYDDDQRESIFARLNAYEADNKHQIGWHSAGNLRAPVVLVGEKFAHRKVADSFYQYPFVSFSNAGCSAWLTKLLDDKEISEYNLLWVNSDSPDLKEILNYYGRRAIFALGDVAHQQLEALGVPHTSHVHPQHAKRFHHRARYLLIDDIKKAIENLGATHES